MINQFEQIENIQEQFKNDFEREASLLNVAINRIHLDRAIYGKFNMSLENLFVMIYNFINHITTRSR